MVTVITIVIRKRKSGANKVRKKATTDENPAYGIYDDGPCYNVVTDENTAFYFVSFGLISKVLDLYN